MQWERMTVDEYTGFQQSNGMKLVKLDGIWWADQIFERLRRCSGCSLRVIQFSVTILSIIALTGACRIRYTLCVHWE